MMERQYSSAIFKYEKISAAFWFESRERTGVGKFPLVDCKKYMGAYMHYTPQCFSALFLL